MKKLLAIFILLSFVSASFALEYSAGLSIKTGDVTLDVALSNVNQQSSTPAGAAEVKVELEKTLFISKNDITLQIKKGFTLAEIYFLGLLAKQTGKKINDIASLKNKGVGWGTMAKKLGVKPSDLNKLRVELKKQAKSKTNYTAQPAPKAAKSGKK